MRAEPVPSAEVDVCDQCGGLWIDWFDGNIETLATEAEAARVHRGTPPPGVIPAHASPMRDPRAPSKGSNACPRCMQMLIPELYKFQDASEAELLNGVELLRCTDCAGSFVPRPSAHLLLARVTEPRTVTLWEALVAMLKNLVRGPNLKA